MQHYFWILRSSSRRHECPDLESQLSPNQPHYEGNFLRFTINVSDMISLLQKVIIYNHSFMHMHVITFRRRSSSLFISSPADFSIIGYQNVLSLIRFPYCVLWLLCCVHQLGQEETNLNNYSIFFGNTAVLRPLYVSQLLLLLIRIVAKCLVSRWNNHITREQDWKWTTILPSKR